MSLALVGYQVVLVAATLACLGVAYRSYQQRDALAADKITWINLAAVAWTVFTLGSTVVRGQPRTALFVQLTIPAVGLIVVALVAFTLEYTGRSEYLDRRTYLLLAIEPVVASVLALTNGSHELLWTIGAPDPTAAIGYELIFNLGFLLHTVYSYILLLGVVVLLGEFALSSDFLYQRQVFAMFIALFAPWIGNALFIFTPLEYDLTQIGFAVTGVSLGWAILSVGFLDITPVARDTVIDTLEAGVFVVDTDGRLVDVNDHGRELLGIEDAHVTGRQMTEILDPVPEVRERYEAVADQREPDTFEFDVGGRAFTVRVSPLFDERDRLAGRVFLLQEITEQVERQQQLEQRNEQLDHFASIVSHDLRNPLNVASARLELARETHDDEEFDAVEDAHERMERIISDVLALTRTDGDDLETEPVSLAEVAEAAWQNVDTRSASLSVTLTSEVDANRSMLVQVFENLYRNAVEHAGPEVTVTVGDTDDGFFVADDGPGIPEHQRDTIFEDGVTGKDDGTGLGLTIVDQIARAHDWSIAVTESDQGGARFEFSLPASETPEPVTP